MFILTALLALLLVAVFGLKELVAVRRQVSSIRQFLEWSAVGFLETRKDNLTLPLREYLESGKQDLIREGLRDGIFTEQQIHDLFQNAEEEAKDEPGGEAWWRQRANVYKVQVRRGDHWMSIWRGFSHDQAIRICQWGQKQDREMRIVQEGH